MKSTVRTLALAASLGLALPATPAEPVKAPGQVSPTIDALQSLAHELTQAEDPKLPMRARLDRLETFHPTPATADKLRAVFGTATPFLFQRQPAQGGRSAWRFTLLPLHHVSGPDSGVDWDAAILDLTLDRSGTLLDSSGSWNSVSASSGDVRLTARGATLTGHSHRGYADMWFGSMQMRIADVRLEPKSGTPATMDDLRFEARTVEHPKSMDIAYDSRIGGIQVAGERIEDVHFGMRVLNLDKKVMAEFKAASERQQAQSAAPLTPEQRIESMKPLLQSFARSAPARGTVIEIDDVSARYHGNTASLHGRIGLARADGAAVDDIKTLAKRVNARFEIKVPLALVRDIAGAMAARQSGAQQPNAATGQTITDVIVGKLVGGGFARVENDALVSTVEWRDGVLRADGKPVPLPTVTPPTTASQTVATGASTDVPATPLPPDALRARRVDGSCRMPDYPDEVVQQNRPLRLVLSYRISAEGKVLDPAIASPSRFPAWDQAALAALAQCTYVPALKNGAPVELPMLWTIQREPGTARP